MGTLVAPQCEEGADGRPRKSLATVLLYRGEVRRWRTSVRYADHVTTVACRWLLCPFGHLWLCHPPAAVFCKNASFRGVLRYIVRPPFWLDSEYKNHTTLYSHAKTAANQGFQMAKSIAADAKMTRLIVRPPGRLRRRLYFEPHLTCGSLPRPRARTRPRDAARPAARCRSGWHGGYILFPAPGLVK